MLSFFLKIMNQKCGSYVCVQLLQTLNILFENIRNETSICKTFCALIILVTKHFYQFPKLSLKLCCNNPTKTDQIHARATFTNVLKIMFLLKN
jgi:hypothetical protein